MRHNEREGREGNITEVHLCRLHNLTWHNNAIPEAEIWVKIGGDKGGNSFKLTFQIVNVEHPNSPHNTCILLAFQASDSYTNLKVALVSYTSQISELQKTKWRYSNYYSCIFMCKQCHYRGKQIRVFMNGDYEYLTRVYGLSGASG